jgi:thiol-disulfide isomerase/thioredoxin
MKILVFEQDNCGWCTRLHPHITRFAEDNDIPLEFVDITDKWEIAEEYKFRSTPTVVIIDEEMIVKKLSIDDKGIAGILSRVRNFIYT